MSSAGREKNRSRVAMMQTASLGTRPTSRLASRGRRGLEVDSWWSGPMPGAETVVAGMGGDDALNADLLGSLRDTVRQMKFRDAIASNVPAFLDECVPGTGPRDAMRPVVTPADTSSPFFLFRACTISPRSLISYRSTTVWGKTRQVRRKRTTRSRVLFASFR